jgi:hypothetical protein
VILPALAKSLHRDECGDDKDCTHQLVYVIGLGGGDQRHTRPEQRGLQPHACVKTPDHLSSCERPRARTLIESRFVAQHTVLATSYSIHESHISIPERRVAGHR